MSSEKKYTSVPVDIVRDNYSLQKTNNSLKYILGGCSVIIAILIIFFSFSGETNYEKGMKYLHEKQYTEALFEFQKVGPDESDFKLAQSKINYINGLKTYNDGIPTVAVTFLNKVDPSDQYYRETRLMIEKINLSKKNEILESLSDQVKKVADTIIMKEELAYNEQNEVSNGDAKPSSVKSNNRYFNNFHKQVMEFEDQYQSAITVSDAAKKIYLETLDSLYNIHIKTSTAIEADSKIVEINKTISSWKQKRIDLVNDLITIKSGNLTETLRTKKEEGDKEYYKLLALLSS